MFEGSFEEENHRSGGLPDPRLRFFVVNSSMPSGSARLACFFNSALSVVSFRFGVPSCPSSSELSEDEVSEPDILSSSSARRQLFPILSLSFHRLPTSHEPIKLPLPYRFRPTHLLLQVIPVQIASDMTPLLLNARKRKTA